MPTQEEGTLAVGSGAMLLAFAESWYESGLSKLTVFISDMGATDTATLMQLRENARRINPEASLEILGAAGDVEPDWRKLIEPFQWMIYIAQAGDWEKLRQLQEMCITEEKQLLPATAAHGLGLAGPLIEPGAGGSWDLAWRRIHASMRPKNPEQVNIPTAASAVLMNVVIHQWQKMMSVDEELDCRKQCYILEPETLTGRWHKVLPHPCVSGNKAARQVQISEVKHMIEIGKGPVSQEEWFSYFREVTSEITGIFHAWGEGDLIQISLAQCLVQPVDPLIAGPAQLLPEIVCSGLTHEEARRESGLAGLEAYAARMLPLQLGGLPLYSQEGMFIGAGSTVAEAVGRAIQACLNQSMAHRQRSQAQRLTLIAWPEVEDIRCRYYLEALNIINSDIQIAVGEPLHGFPVVWVYSGSLWYGCADLSFTLALRHSLKKALEQAEPAGGPVIVEDQETKTFELTGCEPMEYASLTQAAIQTLEQSSALLKVFDLRSESLFGEGPFVLYGIILVGEEKAT